MRDSRLKLRPRSEIIQGVEEAGDRKRMRRMANNEKNSILVADDDMVVDQILSRLPVKSLMRFKCVCKAWKSIIERDSHLIDSHNAHSSQARLPGLLMIPRCIYKDEWSGYESSFFSAELHCADDDSDGGRKISGATVHRLGGRGRIMSSRPIVQHLGPVRGLLCLVDDQYAVQVYNVSTGQAVTPWITSAQVMNRLRQKAPRIRQYGYDASTEPRMFQFGFDPSTGKYKVLFTFDDPAVCEVLTVGVDASWRRIDQVPPCEPGIFEAYANGSIYWLTCSGPCIPRGENYDPFPFEEQCEFLMAFDVGSEKFRTIRIPSFTFWGCHPFPYLGLFEMDGCLTVVRGRRPGALNHTVKMWKFHDYGKLQGTNGTSSSSIEAERDWSEVTIELPPYVLDAYFNGCRLRPIPEKDLMIIIQFHIRSPPCGYGYNEMAYVKIPSYYAYNMINKTLSKFEVEGILPGTGFEVCDIFAECLFSGTSNLTYMAPSVRPVPPRNVPIATYPWSSSPPTQQDYFYPAPYIPRNVPIAIYPWSSSPPTQQGYRYPAPYIRPVPPLNVPIAIYPRSVPPTRQGFLPPQVGHHVGQFAIAPQFC